VVNGFGQGIADPDLVVENADYRAEPGLLPAKSCVRERRRTPVYGHEQSDGMFFSFMPRCEAAGGDAPKRDAIAVRRVDIGSFTLETKAVTCCSSREKHPQRAEGAAGPARCFAPMALGATQSVDLTRSTHDSRRVALGATSPLTAQQRKTAPTS
jgi:hypothetical protein